MPHVAEVAEPIWGLPEEGFENLQVKARKVVDDRTRFAWMPYEDWDIVTLAVLNTKSEWVYYDIRRDNQGMWLCSCPAPGICYHLYMMSYCGGFKQCKLDSLG